MVQRQGVSKGLLTLLDQIDALAPQRNHSSDGTIGDEAHRDRTSDHNPDAGGRIRALDITKDIKHGVDVQKIADQIIASRDPRVSYMIHNGRMVRSYEHAGTTPWVWAKYTGPAGPHEEHLHISTVKSDAVADDTTPWKISGATMPQTDSITQRAVAMMPRLMKDLTLHDFQAAGMVGNFGQESRMGELYHQVGGNAIGLAQWDGDRKQQFLDFCSSQGINPEDLESSYRFLIKELNTTENTALKALKATETLEEATVVFSEKFERPGKPMMEQRLAYAEQALEAYSSGNEQVTEEPQRQLPGLPGFPPFQTIPGLSTAPQSKFGNVLNAFSYGMAILDLFNKLPRGMTLEDVLLALKTGLEQAVYGRPQPVTIDQPRSEPMPTQTSPNVNVPIQSASKSKINWVQVLSGILQATNLGVAVAGGLDPKYGVVIAGGLGLVSNALTWALKTFFTTSITPSSVTPQMIVRG